MSDYEIDDDNNIFNSDDEIDPFVAPQLPLHSMFNPDSDTNTDDDENQPWRPIQIKYTQRLREMLTGNVATKILTILSCMDSIGCNLPLFLDFFSWEDQECVINARIRYACTRLMVSEELPGILEYWRNVPCASGSTDVCAKAVQLVIEEFAFSYIAQVVEKELQEVGELAMCLADEVSDTGLTHFLFENMTLKLSSPAIGGMPKLWALLQKFSSTKGQDRKHTKNSSDLVSFYPFCIADWYELIFPGHFVNDLSVVICTITTP